MGATLRFAGDHLVGGRILVELVGFTRNRRLREPAKPFITRVSVVVVSVHLPRRGKRRRARPQARDGTHDRPGDSMRRPCRHRVLARRAQPSHRRCIHLAPSWNPGSSSSLEIVPGPRVAHYDGRLRASSGAAARSKEVRGTDRVSVRIPDVGGANFRNGAPQTLRPGRRRRERRGRRRCLRPANFDDAEPAPLASCRRCRCSRREARLRRILRR